MIKVFFGMYERRVLINAMLIILLFLCYLGLRITLTSGSNFTVDGILISPRFGLFNLSVIGAGTALFMYKLFLYSINSNEKILLKLLIYCAPLPIIFTCIEYIQNPILSENYQSITDKTIILFSLIFLFIEMVWPGRKPLHVIIFFGSALTFCVAVIALIGSTSILAFWLTIMTLMIWKSIYHANIIGKLLIALIFSIAIIYIINLPFFQEIALGSRLKPLLDGSFEITSITSRYALLLTFFEQFSINPIFGHFKADEYIGLETGSYVHSIIFSLLTHTGIIGFSCIILVMVIIAHSRYRPLSEVDKLALLLGVLFFLLGSLYTFFSWPPFWFFIGFLIVKPSPILLEKI